MKRMLMLGASAIFAGLLIGGGARPLRELFRSRDKIIRVDGDSDAMKQSVANARATLPLFLAERERPRPGTRDYAVKIPLGPDHPDREFIWVAIDSVRGDAVVGRLADVPTTPGYVEGQAITFAISEVTDWYYRDGDAIRGNFSACAIFSLRPPAERDKLMADYGLLCHA